MNGRKARAIRKAVREQGGVMHDAYLVKTHEREHLSARSIRKNTFQLGPPGKTQPVFIEPRTFSLPVGTFRQAVKEYKREAVLL